MSSGVPRGPSASCWKVAVKIALQHARVERDPAAAAVGQAHGSDPLVLQPPRRERDRAHGQRWHQCVQVEVAGQVDPHDARQRLHGAQRRVEVLRGEARQDDRGRGFAPRGRALPGPGRVPGPRHCRPARHSVPVRCHPRRCAPAPARLPRPWVVRLRCPAGSACPCRRPAVATAWARSARWRAGTPRRPHSARAGVRPRPRARPRTFRSMNTMRS